MARTPDRITVRVAVEVEITHRCPPSGSGTMPCCRRTPFEVPSYHRMTLDPNLVTCLGPAQFDGSPAGPVIEGTSSEPPFTEGDAPGPAGRS
jgi:hypothetical protein